MEEEDRGIVDKYVQMLMIIILVPHSANSKYIFTCTAITVKVQTVSTERNEKDRGLCIFYIFLVPMFKNQKQI